MSKKAEERALEAYPKRVGKVWSVFFGTTITYDSDYELRNGYREGYNQAEKDLIPIIDRLTEAILFDWPNMDEVAKEAAIEIALNHHE